MSETPDSKANSLFVLADAIADTQLARKVRELERDLTAANAEVAQLRADVESMTKMCDSYADENQRLEAAAERERDVFAIERDRARHSLDAAVAAICRITSFVQPPDVVLPDGRRMKFHPPEPLLRETWEALSKAIIDAARGKP